MQQKELALQRQMQIRDSAKAKLIFSNIQTKYRRLQTQLQALSVRNTPYPLKEYISGIDSMQTALRFLAQNGTRLPGLSADKVQQIETTGQQLLQLQLTFQQANEAAVFVRQREHLLKDQLAGYDMRKGLLSANKDAFYFQQQLVEYKNLLQNREKLEEKILSKLREMPGFQDFMQKNSYLGQLFQLPDNYGTAQSLEGLQTKARVQQLISQQIGSTSTNTAAGADPSQFLHQQVQQAQQQISHLKAKLAVLGNNSGSGDMTIPEFKPNTERTKTWLRRVVVGFSLQTQPSTSHLPAMANMALTTGYKFSGNVTAGIGIGYRLGVGEGINHIVFSNQGVNLRSYFELRAKGSWWLTGGAEYNYMQTFSRWRTLLRPDVWQKGALMGLEKKYKVGKRRQTNLQLLFDALYKQHIPNSQPVIFRTGLEF